MSTVTETNPRLLALTEAGVSVWLDQIRRSLVESGELARMIAEDCLRGMTANPSIFEKAILGSTDYDAELERLAACDVQLAADVLSDVHRASGGRDGFVSLEVSPALAHDTEGTLAEVRSYWQRLERPNAMIKIPGTPEGVPAIEQALYEGINVNVTLLFAVSAYEAVAEAYIRPLERRLTDGLPRAGQADVHHLAADRELRAVGRAADRRVDGQARARNVPVVDEPLAAPQAYGKDRVIIYLRNSDQPLEDLDEEVSRLATAGQPTLTVATHGPADLGRIFFMAEFATAVAGWALEINPFDQPNVEEAKDATKRVLESGATPSIEPAGDEQLRALLTGAGAPQYVAIMGFLPPSEALDEAVAELRAVIRSSTGAATTFGYGPRFLHSTGQLHEGGPPTGRFLQLIDDPARDLEIPGAGHSFGTLIAAQAAGDLLTLRAHGLPTERVRLEGAPAPAVRALTERIAALLARA